MPASSKSLPEALQKYVGRAPACADPLAYAAGRIGVEMSTRVYGEGTADYDQKVEQVALNTETVDWLYRDDTVLCDAYRPGTRPFLERLVAELAPAELAPRERLFRLLDFAYGGYREMFPHRLDDKLFVFNAAEEELIKVGGGQCECRARLICCLAQIAGFPARFVAAYSRFESATDDTMVGGHAINEIYLEGAWAFFDSLWPRYWELPDGRVASLWELLGDSGLCNRQPAHVLQRCGGTENLQTYYHTYLSGPRLVTLTRYSANDASRYDWRWHWHGGATAAADKQASKDRRKRLIQQYRYGRE